MSLIEALTEIIDDMERDSQDDSLKNNFCGQVLKSYAKQIRRAIKAAEGSLSDQLKLVDTIKQFEKPNWEAEAREEFRKKNSLRTNAVDIEESISGQQIEIADGPMGGNDNIPTYWVVPSGGKPGSKAVLDGKYVYRLGVDNKLYFLEDETKALTVRV